MLTLPAQHTTFNTLDNWAIKTPPNQKGGPERKGYRVMARNMYTIHSVTLSFRLTGTVCRSASLLLYIHTQVYPPINTYLFSLIFPSGKTRTVSCQLIYWSTYPQTFQKINRPVYVDSFLPANHKDLHARIKDINYKNVQVEH